MFVYIFMLIVTLILIDLSKFVKKEKTKRILIFLSMVPFCCISAFRSYVGTDFENYVMFFKNIDYLPSDNLEVGFMYLIKLCKFLSNEYQIFFIVTSFVINYLIFNWIFKNSKNIKVSILIYFLCAFFFESMNIVRQYIAITISLYAFELLLNKKYILSYTLLLLCCFFHYSSVILFLVFYIVDRREVNVLVVSLVTIILLVLHNYTNEMLEYILSFIKYKEYIGSRFAQNGFSEYKFFMQLLFYVISLYCMQKKSEKSRSELILYNMQALCLMIYPLTYSFILFERIFRYISVYQIISLPNLCERIDNKKEKIFLKCLIIAVCIFSFFVTNVLNNSCDVLPYNSIFS